MSLVVRWRLESPRVYEQWPAEFPSYPQPPARRPFYTDGARPCAGPGDTAGTKILPGTSPSIFTEHHPSYSIVTTGMLTLTGWLRFDETLFPGEGTAPGYVHPFAKVGEWALRFYPADSDRPHQLAAYAFNPQGGFGAGARYASSLVHRQWHFFCARYNWLARTIALSVDGVEAQSGERSFTYHAGLPDEVQITPEVVDSPVTIGSRNGVHFFRGGVADFRIYDHVVSAEEAAVIAAEVNL